MSEQAASLDLYSPLDYKCSMRNIPRKTVSVWLELLHLVDALDGARALLDALTHESFDSPADGRRLPIEARAIQDLVLLRLRELCQLIRRDLDPAKFWAPHNDTVPGATHLAEKNDVCFEEWPHVTDKPARATRRCACQSPTNQELRTA